MVADAGGVGELVDHGVAADAADAGRMALSAGLDVEMGGSLLIDGEPIIREDLLESARLDDAVLRVLRLKQALGLFDNPYVDELAAATGPDEASLEAVRATAARCTVLLKNDSDVLPLKPRGGQRVLVVVLTLKARTTSAPGCSTSPRPPPPQLPNRSPRPFRSP